jgi:hypothetical protein
MPIPNKNMVKGPGIGTVSNMRGYAFADAKEIMKEPKHATRQHMSISFRDFIIPPLNKLEYNNAKLEPSR